MSRGFVKEGDQEEIPVVTPRAFLPEGTPNYVTNEGLQLLKSELESLNNECVAAGNNYVMRNFINAKICLLKERINSAVEIDLSKAKKDTVSFGAYVRYNDRTVRIVGVDEADAAKGLVSFISPIAKAIIGKKTGDIIEIKVPKGKEIITIKEVSFIPIELTENAIEETRRDVIPSRLKNENLEDTRRDVIPSRLQNENLEDTRRDVIPSRLKNHNLEERSQKQETKSQSPIANSLQSEFFQAEEHPMDFLPIVNERGNIVGRAVHLEIHKGNKVLHPVIHLHVLNSKGETVGLYWWHVAFGESPDKTLKKKLSEVLKLNAVHPKLKRQYILETKKEKELVYVFTLVSDAAILKSPEDEKYTSIFKAD